MRPLEAAVLAQSHVDIKSNEIAQFEPLVKRLELTGR
jgi:hypothetical protein